MVLKEKYCVADENVIYSTFFDKNLKKFKILDLPKQKTRYDVPSLHVTAPLKEHNIAFIDKTKGKIRFQRNCNFSGKKALIEKEVLKRYKKQYPCISVKEIDIWAKNSLPFDFKSYVIKESNINSSSLRKDSGTISILFITKTRDKKIYFNYEIDSYIKAFKAKNNMYNDKILSKNDYEDVIVKVNRLPSNLISCKIDKNLITKSYISANSLLTYNKLEIKKDVLKGALITSYVVDGSLVIAVETTLLEDANIGDKVRVKNHKNKFFDARLFSKNEAMILQ